MVVLAHDRWRGQLPSHEATVWTGWSWAQWWFGGVCIGTWFIFRHEVLKRMGYEPTEINDWWFDVGLMGTFQTCRVSMTTTILKKQHEVDLGTCQRGSRPRFGFMEPLQERYGRSIYECTRMEVVKGANIFFVNNITIQRVTVQTAQLIRSLF